MTIPKYLVSVANDVTLPPGTPGNTLHLEFNWFAHMIWILLRDHLDAVVAQRVQFITADK